jgi:hypothetical protein
MVLAGSLFVIESSNPIQSILPALRLVLRKHWIKSLHRRSKRPISWAIRIACLFVGKNQPTKELNILSGGHTLFICVGYLLAGIVVIG